MPENNEPKEARQFWGLVLGLVLLIIIIELFSSCGTPIHALDPKGRPLETEQNRLHVTFRDAYQDGHQASAWFYFPGIGEKDTSEYSIQLMIIKK